MNQVVKVNEILDLDDFLWIDYLDSLQDLTKGQFDSFFHAVFRCHKQTNINRFIPRPDVMKAFKKIFEEVSRRGLKKQSYFDYLFTHGDDLMLNKILLSAELIPLIGFDNYVRLIMDDRIEVEFGKSEHISYFESLNAQQLFKIITCFITRESFINFDFTTLSTQHYIIDHFLNSTHQLQFSAVLQSKRKFFHLLKRMFDGETSIDTISLTSRRNYSSKRMEENIVGRLKSAVESYSDSSNIEKIVCVITLKSWVLRILNYKETGMSSQIGNVYNYQKIPYHETFVDAQTTTNYAKMLKFAKHRGSPIRQCLANNENLTNDLVEQLAQDTDELVRLSIAANPKTPLSILELLFNNENKAYGTGLQEGALTTLMVAMHENSDTNLLQKIIEKKNLSDEIHVEALLNVNQSYEYVQREFDKAVEDNNMKMLRTLALSDKLDYEQLMKLVECEDTEVSFNALANSGLPNAVRNLLLEG